MQKQMSPKDLIEMAKRGERIPRQPHSLHDERKDIQCPHRTWRVIVCDNEHDVCECLNCGEQRLMACNFDDEYA